MEFGMERSGFWESKEWRSAGGDGRQGGRYINK
jgi:hypothetical protein